MRCSYTQFETAVRYGFPVANKKDDDQLQLIGCYFSIGVIIRSIMDKVESECGWTLPLLQQMAKIAAMVNLPLEIKKGLNDNKEPDIGVDNTQLNAILKLAAPKAKELEINGGKLSRAEYTNKDPTHLKYTKYSQTQDEYNKQKEAVKEKRKAAKDSRNKWQVDHAKWFHIGLKDNQDREKSELVTRVNLKDIIKAGLLKGPKYVDIVEIGNEGLKIAFSGGPTHNKTAMKKFWGSDAPEDRKLKGEVIIVCTGNAPLNVEDCLAPDDSWLDRAVNNDDKTTVKTTTQTVVSKKRARKDE